MGLMEDYLAQREEDEEFERSLKALKTKGSGFRAKDVTLYGEWHLTVHKDLSLVARPLFQPPQTVDPDRPH